MKPTCKAVAHTWKAIVNKVSKYLLTSQKDTSAQHFNKKEILNLLLAVMARRMRY